MQAWKVYRKGKLIEEVFWNKRAEGGALITKEDVKRSLVDHDGYPPDIIVRKCSR